MIADFVGSHATLADAYRVEARVVVWRSDNALKAPASALFRRHDGWAAFVFDDGRARLREVTVSRRTAFEVQVLSGLKAGERTVLHPSNDITDGATSSCPTARACAKGKRASRFDSPHNIYSLTTNGE